MAGQLSFLAPPADLPEGLAYREDFLSAGEETALAAHIAAQALTPFEFQGFLGKRRTASFGWHYAFDGSGLRETEPIPHWVLSVRERAAALAGVQPDALQHVLLIEYAPGAGIGWHRDRPAFGDVVGISLLSEARIRFRRKAGDKWERKALIAAPRSAYLLTGPARSEWEHSIPAMETLRYSITFRTMASQP